MSRRVWPVDQTTHDMGLILAASETVLTRQEARRVLAAHFSQDEIDERISKAIVEAIEIKARAVRAGIRKPAS